MEWKDVKVEKPNMSDKIVGLTTVGEMKGSYISGDKFRTKNGLYSFTKWKLQ